MNRIKRISITLFSSAFFISALSFFSFCSYQQKDNTENQTTEAPSHKYERSIDLFTDTDHSDQDDMCVWVHPDDPAKSTVISSDKSAKKLFVYNLNGGIIQSIPVSKPGNIDVRYGFALNGEKIDIVACNDRGEKLVKVFKVDPISRKLSCVDDGNIKTGVNYGFSLYKSPVSEKYYAFVSAYPHNDNKIWQFELADNGNEKVSGNLVRSFDIVNEETVEGMVADDETEKLYIGEEGVGIRKYNAEPDGGSDGELIRSIANDPLENDVEGLAIYFLSGGKGYIIASSQRDGEGFKTHYDIFEREVPHNYVSSFMLDKVGSTDGIDVCGANLGSRFPQGIFLAHNGSEKNQIVIVDWGKIAEGDGLTIDTGSGNPRNRIANNPDNK